VPPNTVHYHTGNLKRSVPGISVFLLDIPDKSIASQSVISPDVGD